MVENSLIKLLLKREAYEQALEQGLAIDVFPKELQPVYSCLSSYYNLNKDVNELTITDLSNLLFSTSTKDKTFNEQLLVTIDKLEVSEGTSKQLLASIIQKKKLRELSLAAYEAYEGKADFQKVLDLVGSINSVSTAVTDDEDDDFVTDDIQLLVNAAVNTPGLAWRLKTLNRMLGPLRSGNFGFLFARPETGKTTLLGSEVSFMAEQSEQPVLWFANEDEGDVVKLRIIQGTFGITMEQLLSDLPKWQKLYNERMQGRVKLLARGKISAHTIDKLCAKYNPSLVVIDQLAHIEGFKDDKKNLALGAAYRWARELAKEGRPVIGVHQAGGTGEGVMWLDMNHVDEVKTAAQAHADWILGVGKRNDDGYESIRYFHLSKNKLMGGEDSDPSLRHGKQETIIRPEKGRYEDLY